MNPNPSLMRQTVAGSIFASRLPVLSSMPAGLHARTGLPVVSNRAFVAAWAMRRSRLAAAARLGRNN